MSRYCNLNGITLPIEETRISVFDIGLQRGYGVFDVVRTYNQKLFHFDDHLGRLKKSAAKLRLILTYKDEEILNTVLELLQLNNLDNPLIKFIITGGDHFAFKAEPQPNFIITVEPMELYDKRLYIEGGRLITHEFQREWPEIKSTNYLNSVILDSIRKEQDAVDILYFTSDGVSECSRSSFFMLRNNRLITPSSKILEGITRKIILNLSKEIFEVEERTVLQNEILTAEEVFITSTSKGLMPIVQIDNHLIGTGEVGQGTSKLSHLFERYIENYKID